MNISILTPNTEAPNAYFAAGNLARALDAKLYGPGTREIDCDHLIIIGMRGLQRFSKLNKKVYKTASVIFCDTNFTRYCEWCNEYAHNNGITIYAMPDKKEYCKYPFIPAFQTITLPDGISTDKPADRIVIAHSPGKKRSLNVKGTKQIGTIIEELSKKHHIEYRVIEKMTWEDGIRAKADAHIFIDQIIKKNPHIKQNYFGGMIPYIGGLGKSGIESMLLKSCVITSGNPVDSEPYFPVPPVVYTDYEKLKREIERLIKNEARRQELAESQFEWASKYCCPEFVAAHVTRHFNESI